LSVGGLTLDPIDYRSALACSLIPPPLPHQRSLQFAFPEGETTGLLRSSSGSTPGIEVVPVGRWCVIRDGGCVSPQCLTTYLLVQACQHLWLVASYDLDQHFTWVDHVPDYWLPTAVMLAVAG
jgi:hypothetical protein